MSLSTIGTIYVSNPCHQYHNIVVSILCRMPYSCRVECRSHIFNYLLLSTVSTLCQFSYQVMYEIIANEIMYATVLSLHRLINRKNTQSTPFAYANICHWRCQTLSNSDLIALVKGIIDSDTLSLTLFLAARV